MTSVKKKSRLSLAVLTAALTMASVFALASPASATVKPGTPSITDVTVTTPDKITVKFQPAPSGSGDPALAYTVNVEKWNTPINTAVVKTTEVPETGAASYEATLEGVPAGEYQIVVWAHNNAPVPFNVSPPAVWPVKVIVPGTVTVKNTTAFRPYANWDALINGEYKMWTGCNAAGRAPRLDELTFWRYNIVTKPFTSAENTAAYALYWFTSGGVAYPDTFFAAEVNKLTSPAPLNQVINAYFDAISNPPVITNVPYVPGPGPTYAIADTNKDGILQSAEIVAAVGQAQPEAVNDVYMSRRAQFVINLAEGAEQTDGPAIRLYTAYFNRDVDMGACYWSNQLKSARMSLLQISNFFVNSSEFVNTYGAYSTDADEPGTDAAEFVALIYANVLDRDPDAAGFAYWTRQLQSQRKSPAEVMIGFSEASEFKNKRSLSTGVAIAYIHMLGRVPTAQEYTNATLYSTYLGTSPECGWSYWGCWGPDYLAPEFLNTNQYRLYVALVDNPEYIARTASI